MTTSNFRGLPDCFVRMIRFFVLNFQYFPHMNYIVLQLERNNQLYFAHYHISFSSKEPVHTESVAV